MHLFCLGVGKRWITILRIGGDLDACHKLNLEDQQSLDEKLKVASKRLTQEFNRKIPSFTESWTWKASQHRTFGLYLGPNVLKGILTEEKYDH
jgi:hypothetical protein